MIARLFALALLLAGFALSSNAGAQMAPGAPMPSGHAPPGHGQTLPQNESAPAADLPRGTVEAQILDAKQQPLVGRDVRLGIMFQKISEGESRSERFAKTDASGRVRFSDLTAASEYSYRVTFKQGPAEYSSMPFALPDGAGHRVVIYVFPVTRNLAETLIAMRGFVYIEPRDDVFQFQVIFRVFNLSGVTWVPDSVGMRLPAGAKAFSAERGMSDVGLTERQGSAELGGSFTPGQHDLSFRFQVPKEREESAAFDIGLFPRIAELRIIAEASSQMSLDVAGFETPQVASSQGKRVLVTRKMFGAGEGSQSSVQVRMGGLPVPGSGRWVAVLIAVTFAGTGFASARGYLKLDASGSKSRDQDLVNARELLLRELVDVELAHREGRLGPRAHAEAHRTLIDALARLGPRLLAAPAKRRPRREAAVSPS